MGNYICMYSEGEEEKYLYKYLKHLQDTQVVVINIKQRLLPQLLPAAQAQVMNR